MGKYWVSATGGGGAKKRLPPKIFKNNTKNNRNISLLFSKTMVYCLPPFNFFLAESQNMDKGKINSVVFLDIRKAFDTVNHKILLDKLYHYGIGDEELSFFSSYLHRRTQCCSVNEHQSTFSEITCGVSRGSILGPLLLIIYMNDLPSYVQDVNITMYADDTSIDRAFRTYQQLKEELLPAFAKVCKLLKINKLSLNTVKTELMLIGTLQLLNQLDQNPESTLYSTVNDPKEVRRVKLVKYLGMIVDDKLTWSQHVDYISSKVTRNTGILKRIRHFIPKESLCYFIII